jgi:SOS-response transcriptional repressor LexA
MSIGDRVRRARKHAKLTQEKLGKAVGLKQATISDLEKGDSRSSAYLAQIAHACGVDPYWLATGKGTMEPGTQDEGASYLVDSNVDPGPAVTGLAPEISWVQAGSWTEVCYVEQDPDAVTWHPRVAGGDKTFVLRVVGDSMLPDYPPGRLIFIDPERSPENGDDVIAVLTETDEATFKRLVEEPGSGRMLKAINPAWHQTYIPINGNCRIIGVVVADMRLR